MEKQFILIKDTTKSPLKMLNESKKTQNPSDKYVFEGVFTACSVPGSVVVNRNGRIYTETEVLRHLGYLRDQIVENNGNLLGELDHPDGGRYEVRLKEASHKIIDLWYDKNTHCVMGKLKVLDTPNGRIARELIDEGYPLYVSSRAAGEVNEKTKEVEIALIFTYDIVCTPGFLEAKLDRINESLSEKTVQYITESVSYAKENEEKENIITVNESDIHMNQISRFNDTTIEDVMRPLNEEDEADEPEDTKKAGETTEETSKEETTEKEENVESEIEETTDEEKEKNRSLIVSVYAIDDNDNIVTNVELPAEEESQEANREDILDIKAEGEKIDEEGTEDEDDIISQVDLDDAEETNEAVQKKNKIKDKTDRDIEELESILKSVEKSESVKESIIRRYPFAISLSESNFAKFASLRPKLKKRCAEFIEEHEIYDIQAINELWNAPLLEEKRSRSNFLLLASDYDRDLYCAAPVEIQNAIEEQAKFVNLETQDDVDAFWQRMGLREMEAQRIINEKYISDFQNAMNEHRQFVNNNPLGYDRDYISYVEEWFNNN